MKTASQVIQNLNVNHNPSTKQSLSDNGENDTEIKIRAALIAKIMRLFADFRFEYQDKFKPDVFDMSLAEKWVDELLNSDISPEMYAHGKQLSLKQDWPVSRCHDFIKLCHSYVTAHLPDMRQAYLDATEGKYAHGVAFEVAMRVSTFDLSNKDERITYPRWKKEWATTVDEFMQGKVFTLSLIHI